MQEVFVWCLNCPVQQLTETLWKLPQKLSFSWRWLGESKSMLCTLRKWKNPEESHTAWCPRSAFPTLHPPPPPFAEGAEIIWDARGDTGIWDKQWLNPWSLELSLNHSSTIYHWVTLNLSVLSVWFLTRRSGWKEDLLWMYLVIWVNHPGHFLQHLHMVGVQEIEKSFLIIFLKPWIINRY